MRPLTLDDVVPLLEGHVDIRRRADSLQPLRYPYAEHLFYDPFTRWVASAASGVRLRLSSDTTALKLDVRQRTPAVGDAVRPALYDLFVDGASVARASASGGAAMGLDGTLSGDERASVTFDNLPPGTKTLELWLPATSTVAITGLALSDGAHCSPAPDTAKRIVFHGSSITHCMEAQTAAGAWPAVAARLGGFALTNLGWGGSCLLSGLAARIVRDRTADAIVLKLGINVHGEALLKPRTFADSAHAMLSIIREKHPRTPIAVISPILSPPREDATPLGGPSLKQMRVLLDEVVQARQHSGDAHIRYVSGLDLFGPDDVSELPDDLHPNTEGYRRMGERFHRLCLTGPNAMVAL